ncbi:hypothetical protein L1887_57438 [Cichorium endivia]|nr:hypothetical protein L1887_57438 [Cichorium endivia]
MPAPASTSTWSGRPGPRPPPFNHEGAHYRVEDNLTLIKPLQKPHVPIYFSGASDAAVEVAAKHADVYMMWGEPLEQVRERIAKVRRAAAKYGREKHIRFSLSLRPILGATEDEAWARAERILADAKPEGGARHAPVDRDRSPDRGGGQLDVVGGHAGPGGRGGTGVLQPRRHDLLFRGLRSVARCGGIRAGAVATDQGTGGAAGAGQAGQRLISSQCGSGFTRDCNSECTTAIAGKPAPTQSSRVPGNSGRKKNRQEPTKGAGSVSLSRPRTACSSLPVACTSLPDAKTKSHHGPCGSGFTRDGLVNSPWQSRGEPASHKCLRSHPGSGPGPCSAKGQRGQGAGAANQRVGRIHRPPGSPGNRRGPPSRLRADRPGGLHRRRQVQKGDLLFQIDPRPFQAEVRRLEAQLQQVRATAIRSENEARRGERLRDSNAISAELAESRTSAAAEARAGVAAIQAQLDLAKLNLSFTRVTAPISGRVSRAQFTAGNIVTADVTPLTSVVSTDRVYAYFDADERVYLKYTQLAREGQRGPEHPGVPGPVQRDRQPAPGPDELRRQPGQPQDRHHPRSRGVRQPRRPVHPGPLRPPETVWAAPPTTPVLINDEAVGTDLGKKFVLVMDKDNKADYRAVELGPKLEGLRIVRSGLNKEDRIVVKGLQRVRPGSPVTPEETPMASESTLAALAQQRQALEAANRQPVDNGKVTVKLASAATPRG